MWSRSLRKIRRGGGAIMQENLVSKLPNEEIRSKSIQEVISQPPLPKCQCSAECNNIPLDGSLFCEEHQQCTGSPLSGYEPDYNPELYNNDQSKYKSHNCYAYSMNVLDSKLVRLCKEKGNCRQRFHQPGAVNGDRYTLNSAERRSCGVVERLMKADVPDIEKTTFEERCPAGKSKIALVVDPGEDYHFYRQDSDGMWSHKDGSNKVKRYDGLKRPIFNPQKISRDYRWQGSDLNYEDFCGFYCVPRDHDVHLEQGGGKERQLRLKERSKKEVKTRRLKKRKTKTLQSRRFPR